MAKESEDSPIPEFDSLEEEEWYFICNIFGACFMIFCVAVIAGLFLGMLTLDAFDLLIKERASLDPDEKNYARALYPIVKEKHLLLVTLLLLNALCYEALPIFLDRLVPGWIAVLLSTTLVLLFGEILPSAIFTGPDQLKLGYQMVPLVKVLLWLLYPIAKPLSLILDKIVHPEGEDLHSEEYNRAELAALVKIQYEKRMKQHQKHRFNKKSIVWNNPIHAPTNNTDTYNEMKKELMRAADDMMGTEDDDDEEEITPDLEENLRPPMEQDEVNVVLGALQLKTKVTMDVYTPLRHLYAVPENLELTKDTLAVIYGEGWSRIPVYRPRDPDDPDDMSNAAFLGFIMAKTLMMINWDHEREVSTIPITRPDAVSPRMNLVRLLKLLREGGSLMAFVCARPDLANRSLQKNLPIPVEAGLMGVVTLSDVMESILQTRIYDEDDISDRTLAIATLQNWAIETLQRFARKKKKTKMKGKMKSNDGSILNEFTPLIVN